VHGRNELEERNKPKWLLFLEQFYAPMPCMIWVACGVELLIEDWTDFWILLSLQFINASVSFYEAARAGDAVAALKAALKPAAVVKRDGRWANISAALLVPGDLVTLAAGAAVPADCIVNGGSIDVDQAALTGESLPVSMLAGDRPKMGSTVSRGEVEATVEYTGARTFFGKTAAMIQSVEQVSNIQRVLIRIMIFLLAISFVLCGLCLAYLLLRGEPFLHSIAYVVVLLVASIPIAMEVVTTTTMALGSRELSQRNAIVSRLAAIEELAGMSMLCSDKTGTLTLNKMVIQAHTPVFQEGLTQTDILRYAALAARWNEPPKDALDTLVLGAFEAHLPELDASYEQLEYVPFDPHIKRTEATIRATADGSEFRVTKGAPDVLLHLLPEAEREAAASGDATCVAARVEAAVEELAHRGIRSLAVAHTVGGPDGEWRMLGMLTFLDPPRPDTAETLARAREYGIDIKMVTGDHKAIARETCRQLGLGDNILGPDGLPCLTEDGRPPADLGNYAPLILGADGFAQVFPEHKFLIVEALRRAGYAVGMTGDGVNDAPALKKADIGIAVQGSTDAARAAADIVLTSPGLSVIIDAIAVSRCIFQRIQNFVIYRVACTLQLLCFFFIALLAFHPSRYDAANSGGKLGWPEYFDLPVVALILITLLNDGTIISIAYDRVQPSKHPETWHLPTLYCVAALLGAVACASSVALLHATLDSHNEAGAWRSVGLPRLTIEQVKTIVYLKVSLSDFLTLFAARTRGFFCAHAPGGKLVAAAALAMGVSTCFAVTWPFGTELVAISPGVVALVWAYVLLWWLLQDAAKAALYASWTAIDRARTVGASPQGVGAARGAFHGVVQRRRASMPSGMAEPLLAGGGI
jgi:H+-transporting ATPase